MRGAKINFFPLLYFDKKCIRFQIFVEFILQFMYNKYMLCIVGGIKI